MVGTTNQSALLIFLNVDLDNMKKGKKSCFQFSIQKRKRRICTSCYEGGLAHSDDIYLSMLISINVQLVVLILCRILHEFCMVQACSKRADVRVKLRHFHWGATFVGQLDNGKLWKTAEIHRQRCQRVWGSRIIFLIISYYVRGPVICFCGEDGRDVWVGRRQPWDFRRHWEVCRATRDGESRRKQNLTWVLESV